jgi:hypothetical protein
MLEQAFKNIDNVLWKEAGCTTELDYTEQTSWLLFLKYLDALEQDLADEATLGEARRNYRAYVEQGIEVSRRADPNWRGADPQLRGVASRKSHAAASRSCQGR